MKRQQGFDKEGAYDALKTSVLIECLSSKAALVRVQALTALVRRAEQDASLIDVIVASINEPANEVELMGTAKVSYVGIYMLTTSENKLCKLAADKIIHSYNKPDKDRLLYWLKSQ